MDRDRVLRHVNDAARRLLGYERGQAVGSRCKLTTRGVDCENACPLTFALNAGLDRIEDFDTVYQTAEGRAVRLRVTVVPLSGDDGAFDGAVEILRPVDPDPGFFMSGQSAAAHSMRQRASELARGRDPVMVIGEEPACRDVALAMHRFSGLSTELFRDWNGSWEAITPWPPGTVYASGDAVKSLVDSDPPDGWRMIVGSRCHDRSASSFATFKLAKLEELDGDLRRIITRWLQDVAPSTRVTDDAMSELIRLATEDGLAALEDVLFEIESHPNAVVDSADLPTSCDRPTLVDELLQSSDPMAALEEKLLREVLKRCGWRMQEAAEKVGVSRVTLWRKMKDLGIERP